MSDFKIIESQEELDSIIKSRLARERESVRKEYDEKLSGFDTMKSQLETIRNEKATLEQQLNSINEKVKDYDTLSNQKKQLETDSLKVKIALKNGIPYEMASRLSGDDEESITKDAEAMAKFITNKNPMPVKSAEEKLKDVGEEAYRKLLKGLKGE